MTVIPSPPAWLKDHKTARRAWQQFMLRDGDLSSADQRGIEVLKLYCSTVAFASGIPEKNTEAGAQLDLLIRGQRFGMSRSQFNAALSKTLNHAQNVQILSDSTRKLTRECQLSLVGSPDLSPDLRNLVNAILPIGSALMKKYEPNRRSIQINKRETR